MRNSTWYVVMWRIIVDIVPLRDKSIVFTGMFLLLLIRKKGSKVKKRTIRGKFRKFAKFRKLKGRKNERGKSILKLNFWGGKPDIFLLGKIASC